MFDVPITYVKAPAVLWMIEQYIGHDRFRAGVRRYLSTNAFDNTETTDLWDAIEAENPDVPLRAAMDSWVFQGGYPIVSASRVPGADGAEIELARSRSPTFPPRRRRMPRRARAGSSRSSPHPRTIAARSPGSCSPTRRCGSRAARRRSSSTPAAPASTAVRHDPALREGLLDRLEALDAIERLGLIGDLWAAVLAGLAELGEFLDAVGHFAGEDDPYIWSVVTTALSAHRSRRVGSDRALVARYVRSVLQPELARLGWEASAERGRADAGPARDPHLSARHLRRRRGRARKGARALRGRRARTRGDRRRHRQRRPRDGRLERPPGGIRRDRRPRPASARSPRRAPPPQRPRLPHGRRLRRRGPRALPPRDPQPGRARTCSG